MSTSFFNQDIREVEKTVTSGIRLALGAGGLLSVIIGIFILAQPATAAAVVVGFIAAYAAIAGIINIAIGMFSGKLGTWPRIGYLLLGVLFLVAAVITFANLTTTGVALGMLVSIMIGIMWIIEGVVSLTMIGDAKSKIWTVIFALISAIAGITLITSPFWGAAFMWLLLGVWLVVLGVAQLIRAFRFAK